MLYSNIGTPQRPWYLFINEEMAEVAYALHRQLSEIVNRQFAYLTQRIDKTQNDVNALSSELHSVPALDMIQRAFAEHEEMKKTLSKFYLAVGSEMETIHQEYRKFLLVSETLKADTQEAKTATANLEQAMNTFQNMSNPTAEEFVEAVDDVEHYVIANHSTYFPRQIDDNGQTVIDVTNPDISLKPISDTASRYIDFGKTRIYNDGSIGSTNNKVTIRGTISADKIETDAGDGVNIENLKAYSITGIDDSGVHMNRIAPLDENGIVIGETGSTILLHGDTTIDNLTANDFTISNATISNGLDVSGNTNLSTLTVSSITSLNGSTTIGTNIEGNTTTINSPAAVINSETIVNGNLAIQNIDINGNVINLNDNDGATAINGDFTHNGTLVNNGNVNVNGDAKFGDADAGSISNVNVNGDFAVNGMVTLGSNTEGNETIINSPTTTMNNLQAASISASAISSASMTISNDIQCESITTNKVLLPRYSSTENASLQKVVVSNDSNTLIDTENKLLKDLTDLDNDNAIITYGFLKAIWRDAGAIVPPDSEVAADVLRLYHDIQQCLESSSLTELPDCSVSSWAALIASIGKIAAYMKENLMTSTPMSDDDKASLDNIITNASQETARTDIQTMNTIGRKYMIAKNPTNQSSIFIST